ncbi:MULTISPECIES: response regulator [unclassified Halorhodospira]|uniref:response regulator n=1 Tax=unclassified Halorhodospira TaxID=2626748 RepID=UPI001EE7AA49|nr:MULTISPECIES: response regulator [unclassified Halorhodospira]MCG5539794.1 response regulator [Halorhodospira sp. M39old]MCG5544756.1 response regulator [Halorhodospira sp. M38]
MIRIVLADDHRLVRQAIEGMLRDIPDLQIVEQVQNGEQALSAVREYEPDVVLMDLQMPGMGGIEATRRLSRSHPKVGVIAVTIYDSGPYPAHALRAGARGYVHKGADREELIEAIRSVYLGRRYICSEVARHVALVSLDGTGESPFDGLTSREFEVLMRILNGQRGTSIAKELCLSPKTVSTYRGRLYERLGVRNDAQLTRVALDYGLLDSRPPES